MAIHAATSAIEVWVVPTDEGVVAARGKRVGVVVSGGNVDLARYASLLSPH